MVNLSGKVALVTGGTRGIGKAIVETLLAQGALVVFNSKNSVREGEVLAEEYTSRGLKAEYYPADITDEKSVNEMIRVVLSRHDKIDVLVNNAGGTGISSLLAANSKAFEEIFNLNMKSVLLTTRAVVKPMLRNRYGRIINISSIAGIRGFAMQSLYAAAKAAVIGFSKSVAQEMGSKGITCNVVAPGAIKTTNEYPADMEQQVLHATPLRRLGSPFDVAGTVAFLSSEQSSFITGQVIRVDGGLWM